MRAAFAPGARGLLVVLLAPLAACHLFDGGAIDRTCDDIPGCGQLGDPGDTGEAPMQVGTGVALRLSDAGGGYAVTLDPPYLAPTVWGSWTDGPEGPVALAEQTEQLLVAGAEQVYGLSGPGEAPRVYDGPGVDLNDVATSGRYAWMVGDTELVRLDLSGGEVEDDTAEAGVSWDALRSVFVDEDGFTWLLDLGPGGGRPDLWAFYGSPSEVSLVAEDFASNRAPCGAGGFVGPDGDLYTCSVSGAVYALDTVVEATANGEEPTEEAFLDQGVSDVIACGWDAGSERFLVVSAALGVWAIAGGVADVQLYAPVGRDGGEATIEGARVGEN